MRRLISGTLLVAVMGMVAGCNNDNNVTTPTTTTTTTTTTATTTETFSGPLNMNGGATFPFTAGAAGTSGCGPVAQPESPNASKTTAAALEIVKRAG